MAFQKAERKQKKARIALYGPSGSGKTYTALSLATGLGDKIAVVDTERGSASLYADRFNFDTLELSNFNANHFIEAIQDAEKAGYDVLVIDSLSHAWQGTGGILDKVNATGGNSFTDGWGKVGTPLYNKLMDTILEARVHIVACMRSKTDYVIEKNSRGKDAPRKVGVGAVMRQDAEYEFDYVGLMDETNTMTTQKTRMGEVLPDAINRPNKATGAKILAWLTSGAAQVAPAPKPAPPKADPVAQKVTELGGVIRTETQPEPAAATLSNLLTRFDALPDGTARTAALRTLKADINTEAAKRGIDPFEGRSGEALPDAEKRMRSVLDACIAKDAQPELVAA